MKILIRNKQNENWQLVESASYSQEKELHSLLANSPGVISIDEIRPDTEPLVLAVREINLPVGYIDILAFTANGDIAIIECKLASNTEIKRKVIGQVMDYGAHLWEMRYTELDVKISQREGNSLAELMYEAAQSEDWDEENFRFNIEEALASGNFMLIIVVDKINEELSRIVSFMNVCGNPSFDFAALEMRRFQSGGIEMLVPRVFGPVRSSRSSSRTSAKRKWDEASYFTELELRGGDDAVQVARKILDWSNQNVSRVWWGEGKQTGSFVSVLNHNGQDHQLFAVYTYAKVEIYFQYYKEKLPFTDEAKREELRGRLNRIDGVDIPEEGINRRPSIDLSVLAEGDRIIKFLSIYDWMVEEIRN